MQAELRADLGVLAYGEFLVHGRGALLLAEVGDFPPGRARPALLSAPGHRGGARRYEAFVGEPFAVPRLRARLPRPRPKTLTPESLPQLWAAEEGGGGSGCPMLAPWTASSRGTSYAERPHFAFHFPARMSARRRRLYSRL